MINEKIHFKDGSAYERYMGKWSRIVGESFLDWLDCKSDLRWIDIGCGNGAFTELLIEQCSPSFVEGIDPSEEQLAFARKRLTINNAQFQKGDAMALPFPDNTFDVAVMPLVIFFVPEPIKGIGEMARVVAPGGLVTAYSWDLLGGGFPYAALHEEMKEMGVVVPMPPNPSASRFSVLNDLWKKSRLEAVETSEIIAQRTFVDFNDYWETVLAGPSVGSKLAAMTSLEISLLKNRMRNRLPSDAAGCIKFNARANAIRGLVPG